jgi:hypothetical protein
MDLRYAPVVTNKGAVGANRDPVVRTGILSSQTRDGFAKCVFGGPETMLFGIKTLFARKERLPAGKKSKPPGIEALFAEGETIETDRVPTAPPAHLQPVGDLRQRSNRLEFEGAD